jgi:hypothetical protein
MTRHFGIDSSISLVFGVNANVMYFAYYGLLLLLKIIAEGVLYNQVAFTFIKDLIFHAMNKKSPGEEEVMEYVAESDST